MSEEVKKLLRPLTQEWNTAAAERITQFLRKVHEDTKTKLKRPKVLFSYTRGCSNTEAQRRLEVAMAVLKKYLLVVDIAVKEEELTSLETLESQLQLGEHALYSHAIVFCTRAYAAQAKRLNTAASASVPAAKTTKSVFGVFSTAGGKADTLHVLLCEGDFKDVAMEVVEKNILVRDYRDAVCNDEGERPKLPPFLDAEELALRVFVDHFLNHSSYSNGLGLLPSLLGLTAVENIAHYDPYKDAFGRFEDEQQKLVTQLRLQKSLGLSVWSYARHEIAATEDENLKARASDAIQAVRDYEDVKAAVIF